MCTKFGQNPLKDVDSRVFTRMLRKDGWKDGSVTISLRNFVGEEIIMSYICVCVMLNTNIPKENYKINNAINAKHGIAFVYGSNKAVLLKLVPI